MTFSSRVVYCYGGQSFLDSTISTSYDNSHITKTEAVGDTLNLKWQFCYSKISNPGEAMIGTKLRRTDINHKNGL